MKPFIVNRPWPELSLWIVFRVAKTVKQIYGNVISEQEMGSADHTARWTDRLTNVSSTYSSCASVKYVYETSIAFRVQQCTKNCLIGLSVHCDTRDANRIRN